MKKEVIEIQVQGTGEGVKQVDKINDSIKDTKVSAKEASNETKELSKSAVDGAKNFRFMGVSINGVSKTLKLLKISLIATGIGAIVVAVGALAAAFLSTQSGVDKLNSVLTPLKEVLATIWGIAQKLGAGLFKMVNGDIEGGFNDMASAVENLGDQMDIAWQRGKRLAELQIEIEERGVNQSLVISRQNRFLNEQLEIAEDLLKTDEERRVAFVNARATQEVITKLKLIEKDAEIELAELKVKANDTDREAQKELNDLLAQREDIQAQGTKQQTLLLKKQNTVKEEAGDTPEKLRERVELIQTTADTELDIIKTKEENITNVLAENEERRTINAKNAAEERIRLEEQVRDAKINIASNVLGLIGAIAERGSGIAKAAAITQATISGFQGVQNAFTTASLNPITTVFPAYPFIQAGLAGAFSAVQIGKILSTPKSGGGTRPGGSVQRPSTPQVQAPDFNIVGSSGTNQLAGAIGSQTQQPVKAFVVGSDVSTQQQLDRNIIDSASVG
jgi:hypothetical protein